MGIKTYRPYTPSRRHMTGSDFAEVTKTTPEKSLLASKSKTAGRNNQVLGIFLKMGISVSNSVRYR